MYRVLLRACFILSAPVPWVVLSLRHWDRCSYCARCLSLARIINDVAEGKSCCQMIQPAETRRANQYSSVSFPLAICVPRNTRAFALCDEDASIVFVYVVCVCVAELFRRSRIR